MVKRFAYFCFALALCIAFISGNAYAEAPTANAGIGFSAFEGETVTLNGTGSFDPEGGELTYLWEQIIVGVEETVVLSDENAALPTFEMPASVAGGNQLEFSLTVTDSEGLTNIEPATVVITNAAQIDCNVSKGFDFTTENTETIGYLTALEIDGVPLDADLEVVDPTNPEATLNVVGVLESVNWNNAQTKPLSFVARISASNKLAVDGLTLVGAERVLMKFSVFTDNNNTTTEDYYASFHTNNVTVAGLQSQLVMGETVQTDVPDPANYRLTLDLAADTTTAHLLQRTDSLGLALSWIWGNIESDGPTLDASVDDINFGIVDHGTSPSETLTIENTGTSDLHIGTVGTVTQLAKPFVMTADACSDQVLPAGDTCTITVQLDASLIAAVILPTTTLTAGLLFFGAPTRRNRILKIIMMVLTAAALFACAPDRDWFTGAFDIPSNDPSAARTVIGVMADVEDE